MTIYYEFDLHWIPDEELARRATIKFPKASWNTLETQIVPFELAWPEKEFGSGKRNPLFIDWVNLMEHRKLLDCLSTMPAIQLNKLPLVSMALARINKPPPNHLDYLNNSVAFP